MPCWNGKRHSTNSDKAILSQGSWNNSIYHKTNYNICLSQFARANCVRCLMTKPTHAHQCTLRPQLCVFLLWLTGIAWSDWSCWTCWSHRSHGKFVWILPWKSKTKQFDVDVTLCYCFFQGSVGMLGPPGDSGSKGETVSAAAVAAWGSILFQFRLSMNPLLSFGNSC